MQAPSVYAFVTAAALVGTADFGTIGPTMAGTSRESGAVADDNEVSVYFNPRCSKCQDARGLLEGKGVDADYVRYLEDTPSRVELERVMGLLGLDDPRAMMRTGEPRYRELGLDGADREGLLDAMAANPVLIERPIVIRGDRAVIARPPDKLLDLLD